VSWLAAALSDCARQLLSGPPPRHEGNLAVAKTSERAVMPNSGRWMSAWECSRSHGYSHLEALTGEGNELPLSIAVPV
jgi:hypothetical protein